MRIEQEIVIATVIDHAVSLAQQFANAMFQRMIAPVTRCNRCARKEGVGDFTVGCACLAGIEYPQGKNGKLPASRRESAVVGTGWTSVHLSPETPRRMEPGLERLVQRQENRIEISIPATIGNDQPVWMLVRFPQNIEVIAGGAAIGP